MKTSFFKIRILTLVERNTLFIELLIITVIICLSYRAVTSMYDAIITLNSALTTWRTGVLAMSVASPIFMIRLSLFHLNKYKPRMLKSFLILVIYCLLTGCGLQESFKQLNRINEYLQTTFRHDEITINRHWGNDQDDDYISVLFYNFDVDKKSYDEIKILAGNVRQELIGNFVGLKKLDFIEVKFTLDVDGEGAENIVSFKFDNDF